MIWERSWRTDPRSLPLADRHYNRQKIGSPQFVPPGQCLVLLTPAADALWVTSWPLEEYTQHDWAGAWINSTFRNESGLQSSTLILQAVAATRHRFGEPPELGMVSFVNPRKVKPTRRRGRTIYGYCYLKAGFDHVGFTKKRKYWVWQLPPARMPEPTAPSGELLMDFGGVQLERRGVSVL